MSVTIVGRNREAGNEIVEAMKKLAQVDNAAAAAAAGQPEFDFMECDSSLIRNARPFAESYRQRLLKNDAPAEALDYVVVTAGIATFQGYTPNGEGLDQKLAVHYFGRVAMIDALLPLMKQSKDPRVLTVLSGGVHSPYADYEKHFDLKDKYAQPSSSSVLFFFGGLCVLGSLILSS